MRRYMGGRGARRGRAIPQQWVAGKAYAPDSPLVLNTALLSATVELCGASGVTAQFDPPIIQRYTIMCIRGEVNVSLSAPAGGDQCAVNLGIMVVSKATAYDPSFPLDGGAPWMWLKHYSLSSPGAPALPNPQSSFVITDQQINIRTRRIVRESETCSLFIVVQGLVSPLSNVTVVPCLRTLIRKVA